MTAELKHLERHFPKESTERKRFSGKSKKKKRLNASIAKSSNMYKHNCFRDVEHLKHIYHARSATGT